MIFQNTCLKLNKKLISNYIMKRVTLNYIIDCEKYCNEKKQNRRFKIVVFICQFRQ